MSTLIHCRGAEKGDVLMQEPRAGVLRPSFCLVRDDQLKMIVLAIRGTHSLKVCHYLTDKCACRMSVKTHMSKAMQTRAMSMSLHVFCRGAFSCAILHHSQLTSATVICMHASTSSNLRWSGCAEHVRSGIHCIQWLLVIGDVCMASVVCLG